MEMMPRDRCYRTELTPFTYQKPLRTKKFEEPVPAWQQGRGNSLFQKFMEFPASKNGKGLTDSQNLTKKDFLFKMPFFKVKTLLVVGL